MKVYDINKKINVTPLNKAHLRDGVVIKRVNVDITSSKNVTNINNAVTGLSVLYSIMMTVYPLASRIEVYNPVRACDAMLAIGEYFYDTIEFGSGLLVDMIIRQKEEYIARFISMLRYLSNGNDRHVPVLVHEYYVDSKLSISAIVAGEFVKFQSDGQHTAYWYLIDAIMNSYEFVL